MVRDAFPYSSTGWSKWLCFLYLSLTGTKGLENGKTQPFLFRIYVDILIFWYLSIARWKKIAFNWAVPKQYKFSTLQEMSTQTHPNTTNIQRHHPNTPNTSSRHHPCTNWRQQKQIDTNRIPRHPQTLPGVVWGWLKVPVDASWCLLAQPWKTRCFHLAILRHQNIKMSTYILNKNGWVLPSFRFLVPVREKLKNTVTWITL